MEEMKFIILSIVLCFGLNGFSQHSKVEHKQYTENGITKGWTIKTEYDRDGNIISYDSSYYENEASDMGQGHYKFEFQGPGDSQVQFYNFGSDTSFQKMFYSLGNDSLMLDQFNGKGIDPDNYMEEYRKLLHDQFDLPLDTVPPPDQIIYPRNSKEKKI